MKHYILNAFMESPWAILPQKLAALEAIVARHAAGEKLTAEEIQAAINGAPRPEQRFSGNVAVLPLFGTIVPRAELMSEMSGATSAEKFSKEFDKLLNDASVGAIVLDVNSPGGQARGVQEISDKVYAARGKKPIVAVANHLAASAAYWIASAADELVVTPSGEVGSIGVFAAHEDFSKALDQEGVKVSLISAGKFKVEGNPYEPLGDEARAAIQQKVDEVYQEFVAAISRNRGANPDQVRNGFGEGRTVKASQAVEYGMADRVATLEEVITHLSSEAQPSSYQTASDGQAPMQAESDSISERIAQARGQLEIAKSYSVSGGTTVNVREKIKARAEKLDRAQALIDLADSEARDFSEAERAEFDQLMIDADALAGEITQYNADREKLRAALELKLTAPASDKAEKPDAETTLKVKNLDEFNRMTPAERMAFIKDGGKVL